MQLASDGCCSRGLWVCCAEIMGRLRLHLRWRAFRCHPLFRWHVGNMQMQPSRTTSNPYHTSPDDPEDACFLSQLWLEHGGGGEGHIPLEGTHDWMARLSGLPSTSMSFRALPPHAIFITSNPFLTLCAQYPVVALCGDILNQLPLPYTAEMSVDYSILFCRIRHILISGFIYFLLANHAAASKLTI